MKELNIKLGHKMPELRSISEDFEERIHYPTFHYEGEKLLKLPGKEGVMLIHYCKTSSSERENEEGETHYSCTIEVKEIISAKSDENIEAPAGASKETEEALDKLVKEKRKSKRNSAEDEY